MDERNVSPVEVRGIILSGEPIEYDEPGSRSTDPGILFFGLTGTSRPLHVKVIERSRRINHVIITVYEPDERYWYPDLKTRR
jgi:Domain of unknown function (DUF4258)